MIRERSPARKPPRRLTAPRRRTAPRGMTALAGALAIGALLPNAGWAASGGATAQPGGPAIGRDGGASAQPSAGRRGTGRLHHESFIPHIAGARCVPAAACLSRIHVVAIGGLLKLEGSNLRAGQSVLFPRSRQARISRGSPRASLYGALGGLVVRVPPSAHSGQIAVLGPRNSSSNHFGPIYVVAHALKPPAHRVGSPAPSTPPTSSSTPSSAAGTGFAGQGMWIWELPRSAGGSLTAIIAQAHAAGLAALFVKSGDGTNYWSQFSPELLSALHAAGLKVCAWQYVYGSEAVAEAEVAAEAVAHGADCFVIDAESQLEGHYAAAQQYMETLRAKAGASYPIGLTSFPYVDYHESFPYSVFLGPGGAQFNVPQMYWKDIGITVSYAYVHTFQENLIYGRPICPLGQTYESPSAAELVSFRSLATPYAACGGLSFWDWQETSAAGWAALGAALETAPVIPQPELTSPLLREGARGDQVLWLQEHLAASYSSQPTSGIFEAQTTADLKALQAAHGLTASGETDPGSWAAALALTPIGVRWNGSGPKG